MITSSLPGAGSVVAGATLVRKVGEGAMGVVYEAIRPSGERIALKILKPEKAREPEILEDFIQEGKATGSVDHENVVTVFGQGEEDGLHYIEMEYVDGPPLCEHIRRSGRLPWPEATRIVIQVARALQTAHDQGLVHRDVKPANILLYEDGRARLTDFGIVKDISTLKGFLLPGRKVGTATYASPEQCLGKRLDPMTDVYSLGATFFHLVTGRPPFTGEPNEVMNKHVKAALPPPEKLVRKLPRPAANVIRKMMGKKQTERYPSMARVVEDLEAVLGGRVPVGPARSRVDAGSVGSLRRTRKPVEATAKKGVPAEHVLVGVLLAVVFAVFLMMVF